MIPRPIGKILGWLLFGVAALLIIGLLVFWVATFFGFDESLDRSDKPLTRAEAIKRISVPLPASARDVYFVSHSGGLQEFQFFTRFTVDPKDLDTAVSDLIADRDKQTHGHLTYTQLALSKAPPYPVYGALLPMPWWNIGSFTNGYYRSATEGQAFDIWVDADQHTIYLCTHD